MSWRKGFFRLWLIASSVWVFLVLVPITIMQLIGGMGPPFGAATVGNFVKLYLVGLAAGAAAPPLVFFVLGWLLLWAFKGFQGKV